MKKQRVRDKISQAVIDKPKLNGKIVKMKKSFDQVQGMLNKGNKKL